MLRLLKSKAVRTVLRWQCAVTAILAVAAWPWFGVSGAISAVLGGSINLVAGVAFFALAGIDLGAGLSAGGAIRRMVRAEAGKIMIIVGALWVALSVYKGIEFVPFFVAFALTALAAGAALLVNDEAVRDDPVTSRS